MELDGTDRQTGSRTSQRRSAKRQRQDAPGPKTKGQTLQDLGLPNAKRPTHQSQLADGTGAQKAHAIFRSTMTNNITGPLKDPNSTSASDTVGSQFEFGHLFPLRGMAFAARRRKIDRQKQSTGLFLERSMVEPNGIEPMTSCLQSRRSPS